LSTIFFNRQKKGGSNLLACKKLDCGTNRHKPAQTGTNQHKPAQTSTNRHRLALTSTNQHTLAHIFVPAQILKGEAYLPTF
jgi:hypothetical protein